MLFSATDPNVIFDILAGSVFSSASVAKNSSECLKMNELPLATYNTICGQQVLFCLIPRCLNERILKNFFESL